MRRINRAATLLITTITLSIVTITSATFSTIYFRYRKMNATFIKEDREKITLRNQANTAYEHFLKDTPVVYQNEEKPLRSGWLLAEPGLDYEATLSVVLSNFIANFTLKSYDKTLFSLFINGESYTINYYIEQNNGRYNFKFVNYARRN